MIGPTLSSKGSGPHATTLTPTHQSDSVFNSRNPVVCAGCSRPIVDRFLLNVLDRSWHTRCIQCSECKTVLTDRCFYREGRIYCNDDFYRRFGTKCGGCSVGISPNDMVRKARDKVFHLKCFTCMVCRKQLSTGEELYAVDDHKFICKDDYLSSRYCQGSDGEDNDDDFDKLHEDNTSEKESSFNDDDSIDSGLPSLDNPGHQGISPFGNQIHPAQTKPNGYSSKQTRPPVDGANIKTELSIDLANTTSTSTASGTTLSEAPTVKSESEHSIDSNDNSKITPDDKENSKTDDSIKDEKDSGDEAEKDSKDGNSQSTKRRGPRTTIKAKQLETLKAAFAATPKPTRHIREQLAQETGLNMRVIQVWFQNRRSKERRMKQLSALGARRAFFRNPRRMRGLGDDGDMMGPLGCGYFSDADFYPGPGFPPYPGDYPFPGHPDGPLGFMNPSSQGHLLDMTGHMGGPDHQFIMPPNDMLPPSSQSDGGLPPLQPLEAFSNMPPRSMNGGFNSDGPMGHGHGPPRSDMGVEAWM